MAIEVHTRKYEDIIWSFNGPPVMKLANELGGYGTTVQIDPTPCYSHDVELVKRCAERVEKTFDIRTYLYVSDYESTSRTNGFAQDYTDYYNDSLPEGDRRIGIIFFNGKRTPIHPIYTPYLVAHEFGHIVEYYLEKEWGLKSGALLDTYQEVRNLPKQKYYGPKTWHWMPGEIFANDFRLCVAKEDVEYWPHTAPRPDTAVSNWWMRVQEDPSVERYDELIELI